MAFWGKYGDLPPVEAARRSLQDIAEHEDPEMFHRVQDVTLPIDKRYDLIRLHRTVEGLQKVIWLNGGVVPVTWLPQLFDHKTYRKYGAK